MKRQTEERYKDNIKEWTCLNGISYYGNPENREEWRKLVVKSTVVPQRSARLRDRWDERSIDSRSKMALVDKNSRLNHPADLLSLSSWREGTNGGGGGGRRVCVHFEGILLYAQILSKRGGLVPNTERLDLQSSLRYLVINWCSERCER